MIRLRHRHFFHFCTHLVRVVRTAVRLWFFRLYNRTNDFGRLGFSLDPLLQFAVRAAFLPASVSVCYAPLDDNELVLPEALQNARDLGLVGLAIRQ